MRFACAALQTLPASHMHFGRDEISFLYACDFVAESRHLSAEFMPRNQRRMNAPLGPTIPVVDMQIGPADGRNFDLDQYFTRTKLWNRNFADFRTGRSGGLYYCKHGCGHMRVSRVADTSGNI